jgi:hypothetical protein
MDRKEYMAQYRESHKEEKRQKNREWKRLNRDKVRASKRRWRARHSAHNNYYKYGVSERWYQDKLDEQGGGCAICGTEMCGVNRLHIDHCHRTNRNRGILCAMCNHALERMENVPDWDIKALLYLEQYKGECI